MSNNGSEQPMIPLFKPSFDDEEWEALREPLRAGWVAMGPKVKELEDKFAAYVGSSHAVALNSATAGLQLSLKVSDVEGGEVISPSLTFAATNHAILYNGATPVFADVEEDTLNIDPASIERMISKKTRAIVVVHYGGHSCDMDPILDIANAHNLKVIEDAAHACGTEYKGRKIGTISPLTSFSFHAIKNMTTGDGGMVTCNDAELDRRFRVLRQFGLSSDAWSRKANEEKYDWYIEAEELGYKHNMNDIAATIGIVQLGKLDGANDRRRALVDHYNEGFAGAEWITTPVEKPYTRSARHNYVIRVPAADRDEMIVYLRQHGVSAGLHYVPNHLYEMYQRCRADVAVTERVWREMITLPLFADMTFEQVDRVVATALQFRAMRTSRVAVKAETS
jgi:perosamine synthetase